MIQRRWTIRTPDPATQVALSNSLGIHPVLAQLLVNRQITTAREAKSFLNGSLKDIHDPFLFKDMDRAVARIRQAKDHGELVLIFGDYDVDGVTSSVIIKGILTAIGIRSINYIPHRMTEGYGLNLGIVDHATKEGVSLLLCVDCGISSFEEIAALKSAGIDVIVLDHHEPSPGPLPSADAIINPKRTDCPYPFKGLASVGLSLKLGQALLGRVPEEFLDLVAIGTIADVAELKGENRILVQAGLPLIQRTRNEGLRALLDVAKIKNKEMRPHYVGFILGPRLNATGRMGTARESLDLLLSEDSARAYALARSLEEHNSIRQKTQNEIVQEAMSLVEREVNFKDHRVIVLHKAGWHRGVLGIVASRIVERYYRPAIVISTDGEVGVGSARSIDGFHLFEALTACSDLLENFGGHKRAAGLTVKSGNIDRLREHINDFARKALPVEQLTPSLSIDMQVPVSVLNVDLIRGIDRLEPYGEGNPSPVFCTKGVKVKGSAQVMGKETLKFWVTDGDTTVAAVGFGMAKFRDMIRSGAEVDLAYSPTLDDFNKAPTVALKLKDIRVGT